MTQKTSHQRKNVEEFEMTFGNNTPPPSLRAFDVGDGDDDGAASGECSLLDGLCRQAGCWHQAKVDDPNEFGLASGAVSMLTPFTG